METRKIWNLTLQPKSKRRVNPEGLVHVTQACYGVKVNRRSRSVVTCNGKPICVLEQSSQENQSLDLQFNGMLFKNMNLSNLMAYITF